MNACALRMFVFSLALCAAGENLVAQVLLTNLYSFGSQPNDGSEPDGGLVQGSAATSTGQRPEAG